MPELNPARFFYPDLPYHVIWGITRRCGARCRHCYADSTARPASDELSTGRCLELIDEFAAAGVWDIGFTGGEPLMRSDLVQLVAHASRCDVRCGISSNGLLLSSGMAEKLRKAGLNHAQISIDGVGQAHDAFRGVPGIFKAAMKAVDNCKRAGLPVALCFTASAENIEQLPAVAALAEKLEVETLNISLCVPAGRGGNELRLSPLQTKGMYGFWAAHRNKRPQLLFHTSKMALVADSPLGAANIGCQAGIGTSYIDPSGNVTPCVLLPVSIGNVSQRRFEEIWRSAGLNRALRKRRFGGNCGKCGMIDVCGGCRAAAFSEGGDLLGGDPTCWLTSNTHGGG